MIDVEKNTNIYDEKSILVLSDRDSVRLRPWMYIWSTSKTGVHHLVWEIVNNSVDESMAGYGDIISIILNKNWSITITDSGRGIPYKPNSETWVSTLETIFTVLHSGGKFNDSVFKISSWLHGVGSTVTNFLSEYLIVEVKRDGKINRIEFKEWIITKSIHEIGESPIEETGTSVTFKPSAEIFSETEFDISIINNYLEMQSYLLKGLRFSVRDDISEQDYEFYAEHGLLDFLTKNTENKAVVCHPIAKTGTIDFKSRKEENKTLTVDFAFQWIDGNNFLVSSFVNGAHTTGGGYHVEGFKNGIKRSIEKWLEFKKIKIKDLEKDDIFLWLEGILSANFFEPEFEGQTKGILGTREVLSPTSQIVFEKLYEYLELNPNEADKIIRKIQLNVKLRLASENAQKEIYKNKGEVMKKVINRYWACSSRTSKEKELYIVEGNSAAGSVVDWRNPKTQAIVGLRGVVLNTEWKTLWEVAKNAEIQTILAVLDCGVWKNYSEEKLQFNKIIIACDADSDGSHIESLILTFLFRFLPELFKNGHVFVSLSPLYSVEYKGQKHYFYSHTELNSFLKEYPTNNPITRFKGLGEMNPEQAEVFLCNPKSRKLVQLTTEDEETFSQTISDLMWPNSTPKYNLLKEMKIDRELIS